MALISSCHITRHIEADKSILTDNYINVLGVEKDIINDFFYKDDLFAIPIQKPNKKFLGVKLSLGIWAFYDTKKVTKFSQFMKTKIGHEPILFDSSKIETSRIAFENYYTNIGHFDRIVSTSYHTKNQKTTVTYNITPNKSYKIRKVVLDTITEIQKIVKNSPRNSNLDIGDFFNTNNLKLEREQIADLLNNKGYYTFNKEYISYKLDTLKSSNEIDIYIKIGQETDSTDFNKYKIGTVRVLISNLVGDKKLMNPTIDTLQGVQFIQDSQMPYRQSFLINCIKLIDDSFYSKRLNTWTIQNFTDLNNFKLINSNYYLRSRDKNVLDAYLALTPFYKQFMSFGGYIYNSSQGLLGSSLALTYNNRNLTRRADRLSISLSGGMELNFNLSNNLNNPSLISRSDISLNTKYTLDKFILPILFSNEDAYMYRSTVFSNVLKMENRVGYYNLFNISTNLGYEWSRKTNYKHAYNPLSINTILIPESSIGTLFQSILTRNPYLKSSFSNSIILGSNYQFSFSKNTNNQKGKFGLKINLETAGNTSYLLNKLVHFTENESLKINQVEISQYSKILSEMVFSKKINKVTSFHTRLKAGFGFAYGNSNKLTYIKQFFIGGPYSLRAFQLRTIGPGTLNPNVYDTSGNLLPKDQLGNMVIEANYEYRFNIVKFIKGAFFMDMGNIWNTSSAYSSDPKTMFQVGEFYKQFYIGGGMGARFDFDYFVIRADMGIPVRVPYKNGENGWVIKDAKPFNSTWYKENLIFNIAVGYPF